MEKRLWLFGVSGGKSVFWYFSVFLCSLCVEVPDCDCVCFVHGHIYLLGYGV